MSNLLFLKSTDAVFGGNWGEDDFCVMFRGKQVGRIFKNPALFPPRHNLDVDHNFCAGPYR